MKILKNDRLEIRKGYFLKSFNRIEEEMAIISFGACNFQCPYCKRNCQYINADGTIIKTKDITMKKLKKLIDEEIQKARKIRLSGGDPCMFKTQSLEIAKYVKDNYNQKISVAHNGSDYNFIKSIIDYLDYIALDFKGIKKETVERITGIKNPKMQQKEIIELCEKNNVLVDVRTPLFAETDINELKEIGKILEKYPNVFWTLRKYNEVKGCNFGVPTMDFVTNIAIELKKEFPNLKIGTRNYWKGGFEIF